MSDAAPPPPVTTYIWTRFRDGLLRFLRSRLPSATGAEDVLQDVFARGELPEAVRRSAELYAGCVAGAMEEDDYLATIRSAGFEDIEIVTARRIEVPAAALPAELTNDERAAFTEGGVWSVTVCGTRPRA